jgi:hypothetical protein
MAGEEEARREEQPAAAAPPAAAPPAAAPPPTPQTSPPWNMIVVLAALVLVSIVAIVVLLYYRSVFTSATDVTTLVGSMFTVVGTVVGAYFGVKATGDVTDKAQGAIETANNLANQALAKLPPEIASEVVGSPTSQGSPSSR